MIRQHSPTFIPATSHTVTTPDTLTANHPDIAQRPCENRIRCLKITATPILRRTPAHAVLLHIDVGKTTSTSAHCADRAPSPRTTSRPASNRPGHHLPGTTTRLGPPRRHHGRNQRQPSRYYRRRNRIRKNHPATKNVPRTGPRHHRNDRPHPAATHRRTLRRPTNLRRTRRRTRRTNRIPRTLH